MYLDGGGLYLQIAKGGSKSWIYRYMLRGRTHAMGLGPCHLITLAEARDKAYEYRRQKFDGVDPLKKKREARKEEVRAAVAEVDFKHCAGLYIESHAVGWRNAKHAEQWHSTLSTYAYPVLGNTPVQSIDTAAVMRVLDPIWRTKTETASRVRGRIEAVLDWASARGYRSGENPARWRGHIENLLPKRSKVAKVVHHAALDYQAMPEFMAHLRKQAGITPRALEFLILTAVRTGEAVAARWSEVDWESQAWTIPADRMKAGREHRVPLDARCIAILAELKQEQRILKLDEFPYIFRGHRKGQHISNMTMLKLLGRMGHPNLTVHGFRSTFRDWVSESTQHSREVAEMALAHTISDKVEAAYRRGDLFLKRREVMQDWGQYCRSSKLKVLAA